MSTLINQATRLIKIDSNQFGLSLNDVKAAFRNVVWGSEITEEMLATFGYAVVDPTARPTGDVVTEVTPVVTNGRYVQTWEVRPFNQDEIAANLATKRSNALNTLQSLGEQTLAIGVPFNFGTTETPNEQHIQVRDGDRANHAGMASKLARNPDLQQPFRSYEDVMNVLTPEQVRAVTDAAYDGYLHILGAIWTLRDSIHKAATIEEIPEVPSSVGAFYTGNLGWAAPVIS